MFLNIFIHLCIEVAHQLVVGLCGIEGNAGVYRSETHEKKQEVTIYKEHTQSIASEGKYSTGEKEEFYYAV